MTTSKCVTTLHYLNGGQEALNHLCFLINAIIDNSNFLKSIQFLPTFFTRAMEKQRILTLHIVQYQYLVAILDTYIGEIELSQWESAQAETQFQEKRPLIFCSISLCSTVTSKKFFFPLVKTSCNTLHATWKLSG